jgi:hypothetical protein
MQFGSGALKQVRNRPKKWCSSPSSLDWLSYKVGNGLHSLQPSILTNAIELFGTAALSLFGRNTPVAEVPAHRLRAQAVLLRGDVGVGRIRRGFTRRTFPSLWERMGYGMQSHTVTLL